MRILITGASGQLGRAVTTALAAAGHEIVGLGRRPWRSTSLHHYMAIDLGSPDASEQIRSHVARCDAVVHAAASLAFGLDDPTVASTNCVGTQQIIRLARVWQPRLVVYLSSVGVVGTPRCLPVTEDHATDPPTAYHASKLFGEALMRLAASEGQATVSLRLTSPVGPDVPAGRILPIFVDRALAGRPLQVFGQGTRQQNYVDVRDAAAAVHACLEQVVTGLYNVAGQESIANADLAKRCIRVLSSRSAIEFSGRPDPHEGERWQVSIAKAHQRFGYTPRHSIEQSIAALAAARAQA